MQRCRTRRLVGLLLLSSCPTAFGQIGLQKGERIALAFDSGLKDNASLQTVRSLDQIVEIADTAWCRLLFADADLGPRSYIRITSMKDGAVQHLDRGTLEQWQMSSAYFNGGALRLELFAGPNTFGNFLRIDNAAIGALNEPPGPIPALCDGTDERVIDDRDGIARMVTLGLGGPCSGTLVSAEGCFFSAGHCINILGVAQFNVPLSTPSGSMQHPPPSDQFVVDQSTVEFASNGIGDDWAHFSCFPNSETGLTPVESEGTFYPIATELPPIDTEIRVTGFGLVSGGGVTDNAQQTDTGPLFTIGTTSIGHRADTTGGNSGSSIINEETNEVIGIHTHAGCSGSPGSFNNGTSILHPDLHPALVCCDEFPVIISQPESASVCTGESVTFSVIAVGDQFTYQWIHDGAAIPGATEPTYVIDNVAAEDAGDYACIVSNPCETISDPATLLVDPPPDIVKQPETTVGCLGGAASFSIDLGGPGPFTYQWTMNNQEIVGATESELLIDPVTAGDFGIYRCVVSDGCGEATSAPAALNEEQPATISSQPADVQLNVGQTAFFTVSASGGALSYQWRMEGQPIPGATSSFLAISNVQCDDAGQYDVLVSNVCGPVASDWATMNVESCPDAGQGDSDQDNDVDLFDMSAFDACMLGPGIEPDASCVGFDFDGDNDVDWNDFAGLQTVFTGF